MEITPPKVTWRNVLDSDKHRWSNFTSLANLAKTIQYPYFTWNDLVYDAQTHLCTGHKLENGEFVAHRPNVIEQ